MTLEQENHWCSNCGKTKPFLKLPDGVLNCQDCNKQLHLRTEEDRARMEIRAGARDPWEPLPGAISDPPLRLSGATANPAKKPPPQPVFGPPLPPAPQRPAGKPPAQPTKKRSRWP